MTEETARYRIISLEEENIKRIRAAYIAPTGNVVEITGDNDQGKSSVLDAIKFAFGGKGAVEPDPVHLGETKGKIIVDCGAFKVTKIFKRREDGTTGETLKVEFADGRTASSPQTLINTVYNELTFDPLEFVNMKPGEQFDAAKVLVPGIDFDAIEEADQEDREARKIQNRMAGEKRGAADLIKVVAGAASLDEDDLARQLEAALLHNSGLNEVVAEAGRIRQRVSSARDRVEQLTNELAAAKEMLDVAEKLAANLKPAGEFIDTNAIRADLELARAGRQAKVDAARKAELNREAAEHEKKAEELTKAIESRERRKREVITKAKLPVPGMSFENGMVMLDGVPLEQASMSKKIRLSVAVAAAMNPSLRVVLVKDASLLDKKSWALLAEIADEMDLQIWCETVSSDRAGAIVIEDGHVASINK